MKNTFKILLASIFLIVYNSANSQETKSSELTSKEISSNPYEARYIKLKELYIKMLDSKSNKKVNGLLEIYLEKSNYKKYKDEIKDYSRIDEWIAQNIAKTRFKSREEAETEWQTIVTAHEKVSIEK